MLPRLGLRIARVFRASAPDPFVLAILLTALTFVLGATRADQTAQSMLDHWQAGFWDLLAFGMQMCLILVTGHALAASPPVAAALRGLADAPRNGRQAAAMVSLIAMSAGLVNWGMGLIVGAVLARDVGRSLRRRNLVFSYPLLCAAGYTSMLSWHGGLSGSAPLAAADGEALARLLGDDLAARIGDIPVSLTTFSTLNVVATIGLLVLIPALLAMLCPRAGDAALLAEPNGSCDIPEPTARERPARASTVPEFLERSPVVVWLIALPALVWLAQRFATRGLDALDLNTANLAFLALGLVLHGSAARYGAAVEDGVRGCAGIVLQFPLYAGIMGMMRESGLARNISAWFVDAAGGSEAGLSVTTFLSAGLVNLFVPSGGGQWAVQAPVAMGAAADAGASPARLVMAVAYGDQWTNMLQPFWALPLLAITGAKARDVVGYSAVALVVSGVWMSACLAIL